MEEMSALRRQERITLSLRALFEQYGYRKYRMGKFEEYELYTENKTFLNHPNIITFHDLDGRVLAMKPDVTLSIAKNTRANKTSGEKVYYLENVYWLEKQSGGYRENSQLGLESIGRLDALGYFEVLCLAQETLSAVGVRHRMQLSHIGFWVSLLEGLGISEGMREEIFACLRGKKTHELKALLDRENIPPAAAGLILKAASLCGAFMPTISQARETAISPGMTKALDELEAVYALLCQKGCAENLILDFSLVNDIHYYDGLVFQGYVEGVPRALLTGGSYGKLLRKFGRDLDAVGFAVYLNELDELFRGEHLADDDALVLYRDGDDMKRVLDAAEELRQRGLRVRTERNIPEDIRFGKIYRYTQDGLKEAGENA